LYYGTENRLTGKSVTGLYSVKFAFEQIQDPKSIVRKRYIASYL